MLLRWCSVEFETVGGDICWVGSSLLHILLGHETTFVLKRLACFAAYYLVGEETGRCYVECTDIIDRFDLAY